jgi:myosin heavy subunit
MQAGCDYYFIKDPETVFKLIRVVNRSKDGSFTAVDVEAGAKKPPFPVKPDACIPAGNFEELENPPDDLIKLQHVNRPGILHTLRSRFYRDRIYTSIGPILVALNPFKWIGGIYDEEVKEKYKSREYNLSDQPHVFAVAHDAYSDLSLGKDQSLIIR